MKLYLVTHPARHNGTNPGITEEGLQQIVSIRVKLIPKIPRPPLVVVGTGKRFEETYKTLRPALPQYTPTKFSPICGSADTPAPCGTITLANGFPVAKADYLGLGSLPPNIVWGLINTFPKNTLLCAGEELTQALGFSSLRGQLYLLDTTDRTSQMVS